LSREDEERSGGREELMESSGMMLVKSEIESCYPGPSSAAAPAGVVIGGAPECGEGGHHQVVVRRRRREPPLLAPIAGGGIGKPLPSITVKRSSRFRGVSR